MRGLVLAVVAFLAAGCQAPAPEPVSSSPSPRVTRVTFADTQTITAAPMYVALERGYYQAQGLDVSFQSLASTQVAQALTVNQTDVGVVNPEPALFDAMQRGLEIKLVAALSRNAPGDKPASLLVRRDLVDRRQYVSPRDLRGRIVALAGPQSQFYVDRFMARDGLSIADVKLTTLRLPDMVPALNTRSIDAAWAVEPTPTIAEASGLGRVVAVTGDLYPGGIGAALAFSPTFARQQPDAARRFTLATLRGLRDYSHALVKKDADPAPVIQILAAHTPVKDARLWEVMGIPSADVNNPAMEAGPWDTLQEYFVSTSQQLTVVDLDTYIDNSFITAALQQLGPDPT
jgi:NitT/TauT family transport system substrate-binding protein